MQSCCLWCLWCLCVYACVCVCARVRICMHACMRRMLVHVSLMSGTQAAKG